MSSIIHIKCFYTKLGSAFVFCPSEYPFESEPSPTFADACGEVTDCTAGCQEAGMYSTRGGS